MGANDISSLPYKRDRQDQKLELAATKRAETGRPATLDVSLLPARYGIENNHSSARILRNTPLVLGRPWTTAVAPVATGSIANQSFTESLLSDQTLDISEQFNRGNPEGTFSVSGHASVSIDADTGVLTFDVDSTLSSTSITVNCTNDAGIASLSFNLEITDNLSPPGEIAFTTGFALNAIAPSVFNMNGFFFVPNIQGPDGTGTFPATARLVYADVLFHGGSGVKDNLQARDFAIFTSIASRTGSAIADNAVHNVVIPWADATASANSSNTWIRYDFSAYNFVLNGATEYYASPHPNGGWSFGSGGNFTGTSIRGTNPRINTGSGIINSSPGKVSSVGPIFRLSFSAS